MRFGPGSAQSILHHTARCVTTCRAKENELHEYRVHLVKVIYSVLTKPEAALHFIVQKQSQY
jgi:hypothetical protein